MKALLLSILFILVVSYIILARFVKSTDTMEKSVLVAIWLVSLACAYQYLQLQRKHDAFETFEQSKIKQRSAKPIITDDDDDTNTNELKEILNATEPTTSPSDNDNYELNTASNNVFDDLASTTLQNVLNTTEKFEEIPTTLGENNSGTVINQDRGTGVSSIFNPQIIINDGTNGQAAGISYRRSPRDTPVPLSYEDLMRAGQRPTRYLWADEQTAYDTSRPADVRAEAASGVGYQYARGNVNPVCQVDNEGKCVDQPQLPTNRVFYPGYSYQPPSNWSVPQKHPPVCNPSYPDTMRLPIGIMDYGTPIYALELNPQGVIAAQEDQVRLTNVGSIMPPFSYVEYPYARP